MKSSTIRIFLYGYYGTNNVGDDLLLAAVIKTLKNLKPNIEFSVKCLNKPSNITEQNVRFVQLEKIMIDVRQSKIKRLFEYGRNAWLSLSSCDIFILGGGTLFHARHNSPVNLMIIVMWVLFAKLRGAKIYALGVGVAPLHNIFVNKLLQLIIGCCVDFAVRDKSSLKQCEYKKEIKANVRLTADLIFAEPFKRPSFVITGNKPVLGLTLAASDLGVFGENQTQLFKQLAKALLVLSDKGWIIRLMIFQDSDDLSHFSDAALFDRLGSYCSQNVFEHVRISSNWVQLAEQYADLSLVAGMRFHGHVLSALFGVPFIGLSEDNKVIDLCSVLKMPSLKPADVSAEKFIQAVTECRARKIDPETLSSLIRASIENYTNIKKVFE